MIVDCAVIGGLRRRTLLFDDNKPRNAVTSKSHGFITRDGINPQELKRIAREGLYKYPDVRFEKQWVHLINKENNLFKLETENGELYRAKKIYLAIGFKEVLLDIPRAKEFYGNSLFNLPFCDEWELSD